LIKQVLKGINEAVTSGYWLFRVSLEGRLSELLHIGAEEFSWDVNIKPQLLGSITADDLMETAGLVLGGIKPLKEFGNVGEDIITVGLLTVDDNLLIIGLKVNTSNDGLRSLTVGVVDKVLEFLVHAEYGTGHLLYIIYSKEIIFKWKLIIGLWVEIDGVAGRGQKKKSHWLA